MKLGDYTMRRTPHIVAATLSHVDLTLKTREKRHIDEVVKLVGGHIGLAAKLLGVSRRSLERKGYRSAQLGQ